MSQIKLENIKKLISELEEHRYVQKVIRTKEHGYPEIPAEVKKVYGKTSSSIGSRFNPELIKIIEEMGEEKAYPLYLDSVSLLPGQSVELRYCEGNGEFYYHISWNLPLGETVIHHREFHHGWEKSEMKEEIVSYKNGIRD